MLCSLLLIPTRIFDDIWNIYTGNSHNLYKLLPDLEILVLRTYVRDGVSNCRFAKLIDTKILLSLIINITLLLTNIYK